MARKSRKQRLAPMPAPSLYVHVALYIRLSVEDNKKRGCSVENQKLVLNDFLADKPDFVVYDTYIDNGATGTNFHRPGFQQMLSDIEAGHIDCVIVKDDCVIKARTPQTLENRHFLRIGTEFRAIQRPQRAAYHIETS